MTRTPSVIENTASLRRGLRRSGAPAPPGAAFQIENTASLRRGLRHSALAEVFHERGVIENTASLRRGLRPVFAGFFAHGRRKHRKHRLAQKRIKTRDGPSNRQAKPEIENTASLRRGLRLSASGSATG